MEALYGLFRDVLRILLIQIPLQDVVPNIQPDAVEIDFVADLPREIILHPIFQIPLPPSRLEILFPLSRILSAETPFPIH